MLEKCLDDGMSTREAAAAVAAKTGIPRNKLYEAALTVKNMRQ